MNYKKQRYLNRYVISILLILAMATPTLAAHTLDTSATYQTTSWSTTNPGTLPYTTGSGSSLMILFIQTKGNIRTYGVPTFNGKSFTNLGREYSGGEGASELWYLLLTPGDTGSEYTVSVPNANALSMTYQIATFKSATGVSVFDKNTSGIGSTLNPSQTLTSATNGAVYVNSMFSGLNSCGSVTSPGTLLYCNDGGTITGYSQYYLQSTAGEQAIGWTAGADDWSMQTVVFVEYSPPPIPNKYHIMGK